MDAAHDQRRHVGEILVEQGIIGPEELARALAEQSRNPRPIGKVLVELGIVSPGAMANALAEQHGGVLKTEYGVSAGIHRAPEPEPEPEPERPAEDVLEAWRAALAERDEMIQRLAATVRERDAELARHAEEPSAPAEPDPATLAELASLRDRLAAAEEQVAALREGAAAAEANAFELERLAATVRSREAELAVVRLLDERRGVAEADAEPEPERDHVLFVPRGGAYELVRRDGPPPARGESVDEFVVVRVGASPLPDGPRACAYLAAR